MTLRKRLRRFLADWYASIRRKRLVHRLLDTQGFVVYCPCGSILNEFPATYAPTEYQCTYECRLCGAESTFEFGLYPVPVKVEGRSALTEATVSSATTATWRWGSTGTAPTRR